MSPDRPLAAGQVSQQAAQRFVPVGDALYWPGRRLLAAVDAVLWPLLWIALFRHLPVQAGVVGHVGVAVAVLCGLGRLYRALWVNERYWFTTWRWGRVFAAVLLVGALMKLMA